MSVARSVHAPLITAVAMVLFLAGCSARPDTTPPSATPPSESDTPSNTTSTSETSTTPLRALKIRLEEVSRGFDKPLFVTHAGDGSGRLFVVEQGGTIRVIRDGQRVSGTFLDVSRRISSGGERGLLGLAFAPDFRTSGRFYVDYTDRSGDTVIARFTADDPSSDSPKLTGPQPVLRVRQPYANHNGGCLVFAPDGTLWVGMGDGGAAGDPQNRAQNPKQLLGKLLSLDVEGRQRPKPRVVAMGLRNPWRFSFDRPTNELWLADVGQAEWEEVDLLPLDKVAGSNFGWNKWEGKHAYPPGSPQSRNDFVFPVIEYGHDVGGSITGGYVYRGSSQPELTGTYFYGDFVTGFVAGAQKQGGRVVSRTLLPQGTASVSSFGEDESGEVYVCDYAGRVLRIVAE